MKKEIFIIFVSFLLCACSSDDHTNSDIVYPTNFISGNYEWKNLENEQLYKIDNEEELLEVMAGEDVPTINFKEQTLLLVQKYLPNYGYDFTSELKKDMNSNNFMLFLNIKPQQWQHATPTKYTLAILTDKLESVNTVNVSIKLNN